MLTELIENLYEGGEERWLHVRDARWDGADLHLVTEIAAGPASVRWALRCEQVLAFSIVDTAGGGLSHLTDPVHPVLHQYLSLHGKLFVRGESEDVSQVIGDLWIAHRDDCDDWISFDTYLRATELQDVLEGGSGLIAEGPRFLLQAYAATLVQHGLRANIVGERPFRRSDGYEVVPGDSTLSAVHFGDSYVVAEAFEAERLS